MRAHTTQVAAEVTAASANDQFEISAWRGNVRTLARVPVEQLNLSWDASRPVQGHASLQLATADPRLMPLAMSHPLAPSGNVLQIDWVSGTSGEKVLLGRFRVRCAPTTFTWRANPRQAANQTPQLAVSSAQVRVEADELTATLQMDRLTGSSTPNSGSTVLAETARLAGDWLTVVAGPGFTNATDAVSDKLVYGQDRLAAIQDVLFTVSATYRQTGLRTLEIIPLLGAGTTASQGTAPVWTLTPGDRGTLVSLDLGLSDDGLYNGVIATGVDFFGEPISYETHLTAGGPLDWDGPYGHVPVFLEGQAGSPEGLAAETERTLQTQAAAAVRLDLTTLAHPALQIFDLVQVMFPTPQGLTPVVGTVQTINWDTVASGLAAPIPAKTMRLTVDIPADRFETSIGAAYA